MTPRYDAIVIGGGHNGLVAAATLARDRSVLVLERRPVLGGAASGEELFPGFNVSSCADAAPRLPPRIARDLRLAEHGLRFRRTDPLLVAPQLDGPALVIRRDDDRTAAGLPGPARDDAARYPSFAQRVRDLAALLEPIMAAPPPALLDGDLRDLLPATLVAARARVRGAATVHDLVRWLAMSVADLADEWFDWEPLRAVVAASGIGGITWGPSAAGTVATLLHQAVGDEAGAFGPGGVVVGGLAAFADALADAARRVGVEVRTEAAVVRILVDDGHARGVELADGSRIDASTVLSGVDPRTTFLDLVGAGELDPAFVHDVNAIKFRGSTSRVHLALRAMPEFPGLSDEALLGGRIRLVPSIRFLERAYDDAKYGEPSAEPYVEVTVPTLVDPSLAPDGQHLMSVTVRYTPYRLAQGTWDQRRDELAGMVLRRLEAYAPGVGSLVTAQHVITPADLERTYGLPEGNQHHGEHTLDQLLYMRPVPGWERYRTPVAGLYLCGAGAHPGGGVTGLPGRNAAQQVRYDRPVR